MYPDDSVSDETAATFTLPDPPETARALIFDCDGTLVDTMGLHRRVWADLFGAHGFEMTDTWWEDHGNDPMEPFVRAAMLSMEASRAKRSQTASKPERRSSVQSSSSANSSPEGRGDTHAAGSTSIVWGAKWQVAFAGLTSIW